MSKPTELSASRVSGPVGASEPLLGGDWMDTWSSIVSMSNKVVFVLALRSLFVRRRR
jgi:hypothetical protein